MGEGEEIEIASLICSNSADVQEPGKIRVCTGYDEIATEFSDWCRANADALKINITTKVGLNEFRQQMGLGDDVVELNPSTYLDTVKEFQAKVPFRICCFGSTHMNLPLASFFAFSRLSPYGRSEPLGHLDFEEWVKEFKGIPSMGSTINCENSFCSLKQNNIWELPVSTNIITINVQDDGDGSLDNKIRRLMSKSMSLDACTIGLNQDTIYQMSHISDFIRELRWSNEFEPKALLKMWEKTSLSIPFLMPPSIKPLWDAYCNHPKWENFKAVENAINNYYGIKLPIIPSVHNMISSDNLTPNDSKGDMHLADPVEINKVYMFPRILMLMFEMVYERPWERIDIKPDQEEIEAFIRNNVPTAMKMDAEAGHDLLNDEDKYPYFAALFIMELLHASQVHGMKDGLVDALSNHTDKKPGKYYVHTFGEKMCLCVHIMIHL